MNTLVPITDYPIPPGPVLDGFLNERRNRSSLIIAEAAARRGAKITWLDGWRVLVEHQGKSFLIVSAMGDVTAVGSRVTANKLLTKRFLRDAGVATPEGEEAKSADAAVAFAAGLGRPIVVKPRGGARGEGVSVNLTDPDAIRKAFDRAAAGDSPVLVEEYIEFSAEFRCITATDGALSVVRRLLPSVRGDGKSTIRQLIEKKNVLRNQVPGTAKRPIPQDEGTSAFLARQGLSLETVLPLGTVAIVRDVGGLSSGSDAWECKDVISPDVLAVAKDALDAIPGLDWSGVDIVLSADGSPYVIEANTNAGLVGSVFPQYGTPRDLGGAMFDRRMAAVEPDPPLGADVVPENHVDPVPVRVSLEHLRRETDTDFVSLARLLRRAARNAGWRVRRLSPTLSRYSLPGRKPFLLTGTAGVHDLLQPRSCVRRFVVLRSLLGAAGLKRPPAKRVRSQARMEAVLADAKSPRTFVPGTSAWTLQKREIWSPGDPIPAFASFPGRTLVVMAYPERERFVIIADRNQARVVLGDTKPSAAVLAAAARTAVEAIRAVPELRWGAVSLVRRSRGVGSLVEGISVDPSIDLNLSVLAGSFDSVWDMILGGLHPHSDVELSE